MKIAVILPAAGLGKRFSASADSQPDSQTTGQTADGSSTKGPTGLGASVAPTTKIEADLAGQPVFVRAIELFIGRAEVAQIILAVNPDRIDEFTFRHGDKMRFLGVTIVPGGTKERWETVAKSLAAVEKSCTHVAIHDAARPLTSDATIRRVFEAALTYDAVIPGLPVSSTLKRTVLDTPPADPLDDILGHAGKAVVELRKVVETVNRSDIVEVQTPQVFEINLLRKAYARLIDDKSDGTTAGIGITDDAGLVESLGQVVHVVQGDSGNLKITRPEDIKLAQALWQLSHQQSQSTARKKLFGDDDA